MLDKLEGYRTYICCVAYGIEQILRHGGMLWRLDPATLGMIEAALLASAGICLRAGVAKGGNKESA